MTTDIAIRVQKLSKCYQIHDTPRDQLKQFALPRLQPVAGQPPKQTKWEVLGARGRLLRYPERLNCQYHRAQWRW